MEHLISIVMHVHNRDIFLDKFLDMLKKQTYKNFELNILETSNLDSSISIIKKYSNLFSINCWLLHTKFVDRTKSLNFLVKQSKGDVICVVDVDVMKSPEYLEEVNLKISKNNFLIQYVKYLDQRNTFYFIKNQFDFEIISEKVKEQQTKTGGKSQISIFKNIFLEIGGFDERFFGWGYEDSDLFFRLSLKSLIPIEISALGIHLWHEASKMFKFRNDLINLKIHQENVENKIVIVKNVENIRLENQWDPETKPIKILGVI